MTTTLSRRLSAVVAYKLGTAVIELVGVLAVLVLHAVLGMDVGGLSGSIELHWLHGIGAVLADVVRLVAGSGGARLVVVALGGDAVISAVEGLLLQRGYRWPRWVILGSTGLLLPWEFPAGGFSLWVETDDRVDEVAFLEAAVKEGVAFDPGVLFELMAAGRTDLPAPLFLARANNRFRRGRAAPRACLEASGFHAPYDALRLAVGSARVSAPSGV